MIVWFVMVIQVRWVDSNLGRMDFRVVSSSIWRKIFGLRFEVSRTLGSDFTDFLGKTWRGALITILRSRRSSVWRKIVVKMTFDRSAIGTWAWSSNGEKRPTESVDFTEFFFGVRRFWRNFGYLVTTLTCLCPPPAFGLSGMLCLCPPPGFGWSGIFYLADRSSVFQAQAMDIVPLMGFQSRRRLRC